LLGVQKARIKSRPHRRQQRTKAKTLEIFGTATERRFNETYLRALCIDLPKNRARHTTILPQKNTKIRVYILCDLRAAICQFHSFSGGFLTTDCTDCPDEVTALAFSYPRYPSYPEESRMLNKILPQKIAKNTRLRVY
jgi:hypothetical protein